MGVPNQSLPIRPTGKRALAEYYYRDHGHYSGGHLPAVHSQHRHCPFIKPQLRTVKREGGQRISANVVDGVQGNDSPL